MEPSVTVDLIIQYQAGPNRIEERQFPDSIYSGVKELDRHTQLLEDIKASCELQMWGNAAKHYCGSGLEGGADVDSYRLLVDQLSKLDHGKRPSEVLVMVAAGCFWANTTKEGTAQKLSM